jgi:protocatechuate 3,4-dioxygenase beta subunit
VESSRRILLVAQRLDANAYRFDIRLRGADETPFFDD